MSKVFKLPGKTFKPSAERIKSAVIVVYFVSPISVYRRSIYIDDIYVVYLKLFKVGDPCEHFDQILFFSNIIGRPFEVPKIFYHFAGLEQAQVSVNPLQKVKV